MTPPLPGLLLLAAATLPSAGVEPLPTPLFDPVDADRRWMVVNDGVMGGISQSTMRVEDDGLVFEGTVSKENNGGFASTRTILDDPDLSAYDGLQLRVTGDGNTYQVRLRTDDAWDGIAHRARFEAPADGADVRIPFPEFRPTWRGRVVSDAPPLDPSRIVQFGFLIGDGYAGPFRLRVEGVSVYRTDPGS